MDGNQKKRQANKPVSKKNQKRNRREQKTEKTALQDKKERGKEHSDAVLHETGTKGEEIRNVSRAPKDSLKEKLVLPSADPSLDVPVKIDSRALQYLALGTVLRALRRGWLAQAVDPTINPYYAFIYLYNSYAAAVQGVIPQIAAAPRYFWELCYALKPKTVSFKTGQINYSPSVVDTLDEGVPAVRYLIGGPSEQLAVFWGVPGQTGSVNGFPILIGPSAPYSDKLGEASIASLWQVFSGDGMNQIVADVGQDKSRLYKNSSAFAAVYAELGQSWQAAGAMATTIQSERFIQSPMLSKFTVYQDSEFFWRGWHEYRKSAGSATYIAPRATELGWTSEFNNKISPIFLIYNFDEFVEQASLILVRAQELFSATVAQIGVTPYPLSFQQFKIMLRQTLLPYFNNDMAQDLRYSYVDSQELQILMLPLVVGPNGYSTTSEGAGMRMPRFFVESLRCCKRLTSEIKSGVIDLVPVLCRPPQLSMEGGYTWQPVGGELAQDFFAPSTDQLIDLIDCSTGIVPDYLDLNGTALFKYITAHNNWIAGVSAHLTALTDMGTIEMGVPALNLNLTTAMHTYEFPREVIPATTAGDDNAMRAKGPTMRRTDAITMNKKWEPKMTKTASKKKIVVGSIPPSTTVRAAPKPGSDYFLNNVGIREVESLTNPLTSMWKYQSLMVKPIYFTTAQALAAGSLIYRTFQIQPFKIPIGSVNEQFTIMNDNLILPSVYDVHLSAANLDVKATFTNTLSEVEVAFDEFQRQAKGGFFGWLGGVVGGLVDDII